MPQPQNRTLFTLDWRLTALILILLVGVVYSIGVQNTHITLLKSELQLAKKTSEPLMEMPDVIREIAVGVLFFLLDLAYMGALLFVAIRTKSKGILLFFLIETIGTITYIATNLLSIYIISKSITPEVKSMSDIATPVYMTILRYARSIIFSALYLPAVYMLYKEYKAGKLIPPDKLD